MNYLINICHHSRYFQIQTQEKLNVLTKTSGDCLVGRFLCTIILQEKPIQICLKTIDIYCLSISSSMKNDSQKTVSHFSNLNLITQEQFPNKVLIGRRGQLEWPTTSPDLNPLDFVLCRHLKTKISPSEPLKKLRQRTFVQ